MSTEIKLHDAQIAILHVLLFTPSANFAGLQKASDLSSDHFNFHLKQMLEQGLVEKTPKNDYCLTNKGKEFANRFDTDAKTVERQPKVAVCLMITRSDGKQLVQQRLKQPFYGYWGRPTGKIRWGETILQAAERELMEETGLTADLSFESIYHKMDFNQASGEMLEDKIFFIITCSNPKGELIQEFEGGLNAWMTQKEYASQPLSFESTKESFKNNSDVANIKIVEAKHEYSPEKY